MSDITTPACPATPPARGSRLLDVQEWIGYACAVVAAYLGFVPAGRALLLAGVILVVTANARAAARRAPKRRFDRMLTAVASFITAYRTPGGGTP